MNRVYKLTPISPYDVPGVESWLADMASHGLILKKFRYSFSTFTKDEPQTLRYRVEACQVGLGDDPPKSMLELYEDFGWDYVCKVGREMLIFSTANSDAPELHSDPEVQAEGWNKVYRSRRRSVWIARLLILLMIPLVLYISRTRPVWNFCVSSLPQLLLMLIAYIFYIPMEQRELEHLSAIVRQLKRGILLDHRTVYPKRNLAVFFTFLTVVFVDLIFIGNNILLYTGGDLQPVGAQPFSVLSLADLEGSGFEKHSFTVDGVDYANFADRETRAMLCWEQWQVVQTGSVDSEEGWQRLDIQWYDLALSPLAVPLAKEELDYAMQFDDGIWWSIDEPAPWTVDYYVLEDVDYLAIAHRSEDVSYQIASIACGDKVALVKYTGRGELSGHIDRLIDMVSG